MIKARIIFADTANELEDKVNKFLSEDHKIISITSFGAGPGRLYVQIIHEEGNTGSKFVQAPKQYQPYIEPDPLENPRNA